MLELCQERGHLGNATAQNLELGLGTFGNVDLGRFGKIWEGHVVIPWEKHPEGIPLEQEWRGAAVP